MITPCPNCGTPMEDVMDWEHDPFFDFQAAPPVLWCAECGTIQTDLEIRIPEQALPPPAAPQP
jgi:uncharacterized Zn finger protein